MCIGKTTRLVDLSCVDAQIHRVYRLGVSIDQYKMQMVGASFPGFNAKKLSQGFSFFLIRELSLHSFRTTILFLVEIDFNHHPQEQGSWFINSPPQHVSIHIEVRNRRLLSMFKMPFPTKYKHFRAPWTSRWSPLGNPCTNLRGPVSFNDCINNLPFSSTP